VTLDELKRNQVAKVLGFASGNEPLVNLLREIGFAESDEVELMHTGPFGAGPLCYRLNRTLIALRRAEAAHILVEPHSV
jgi:ferrous iron transport protein A